MFDDEVHQVGYVLGGCVPIFTHPTLFGGAVGGWEVELFVGSAEVEHQVEDRLLRSFGVAVGFVHLVDHNYRFEAQFDGFLKHETRLRHRAFEGVNHKEDAVGHIEHTLDLAAEVAVARGVDDVNLVVAVAYRDVLGEDGDAAFTLEVVVVEDKFASFLVVAEELGLIEHTVDKGGFTVVDVSDDGDVAYVLHEIIFSRVNGGLRKPEGLCLTTIYKRFAKIHKIQKIVIRCSLMGV